MTPLLSPSARPWLPCALLVLLGSSALAQDAAPKADFRAQALNERFQQKLRPAFEQALGRKLEGAIEFTLTDTAGMTQLVVEESARLGGKLADVSPEQFTEGAKMIAQGAMGKVRISDGKILINPEVFETFGKMFSPKCLEQPFLDVVLLHEAVHAAQHRRHDLGKFMFDQPNMDRLKARMSVVEGHAQVVARAAAKALGLDEAFALLVKVSSTVPEGIDPALATVMRAVVADAAFPYVQGEGFMKALGEKEGGVAKAEARGFSQPPSTQRQVSRPKEYYDPPQDLFDVSAMGEKLAKLWKLEELPIAQKLQLNDAQLRSGMGGVDKALADDAMDHLDGAWLFVARGATSQVTFAYMHFNNERAAKSMLELEHKILKSKYEQFRGAGMIKITKSAYGSSPYQGIPGVTVDMELQAGPQQVKVTGVILRVGDHVLELNATNVAGAQEKLLAYLDEVLPLLGLERVERAKETTSSESPPAGGERSSEEDSSQGAEGDQGAEGK